MIKGSAQKFETLQDQSCKLSIYYPREIKKAVLELEGDETITMSVAEYEALTSGKNCLMPEASRQKILLAIDALKDALTEEEST